MVNIKDFGEFKTAWCPGCGNFPLLDAVKQALLACNLAPHQIIFVSGIGQAAKTPHYLNVNAFNGLHGRALPLATGIRLANHKVPVITESGDGCIYGEGGNHFLAAARRNINLTLLVHNNQVYGLTKGQASPTSEEGFVTRAQPNGVASAPFNAVAVAVALKAGFAARGFCGMTDHLTELIQKAIEHQGFALVDILQPCVSFNKINTFAWYKERCKPLPASYDPTDWEVATMKSQEWGDNIPVGIIYRNNRIPFEEHFPTLSDGPLAGRGVDRAKLREILDSYA
jgi:2-oxoglutarate ferredoxin oxidoreductase subunit beta